MASYAYKSLILLGTIAISVGTAFADSDDARKEMAKHIVNALAAKNWELSAVKPYLCNNPILQKSFDGATNVFASYQQNEGVKAIGEIRTIPISLPPAMAMDTFIPVLFNKQFAPFPSMPTHVAYRAAYIQLQMQEASPGNWCLNGWGNNAFSVNPNQTEDFLNNRGIFKK